MEDYKDSSFGISTRKNLESIDKENDEHENIFINMKKAIDEKNHLEFAQQADIFVEFLKDEDILNTIDLIDITIFVVSVLRDDEALEIHRYCLIILRLILRANNSGPVVEYLLNNDVCTYLLEVFSQNNHSLIVEASLILGYIAIELKKDSREVPFILLPEMFEDICSKNPRCHANIHEAIIMYVVSTYPRDGYQSLTQFAITLWDDSIDLSSLYIFLNCFNEESLDDILPLINVNDIFFNKMLPLLSVDMENEKGISFRNRQCITMLDIVNKLMDHVKLADKNEMIKFIDIEALIHNLHYFSSPNIMSKTITLLIKISRSTYIASQILDADINFQRMFEGRVSLKISAAELVSNILDWSELDETIFSLFINEDFIDILMNLIDLNNNEMTYNTLLCLRSIVKIINDAKLTNLMELFLSSDFEEISDDIEDSDLEDSVKDLLSSLNIEISYWKMQRG